VTASPRRTRRPGLRPGLAAALALGALTTPGLSRADPGTLSVIVRAVRSADGTVRCALFKSAEGFPTESNKAFEVAIAVTTLPTARCTFEGVTPGTYAVSVFHDANGDEALNLSWLGRPLEGWAVSNNAPPHRFSGPTFGEASFRVEATPPTLTLDLRY
jgi:uncharacterized protein (DUF2141 family)